jgi:hypothetical protein
MWLYVQTWLPLMTIGLAAAIWLSVASGCSGFHIGRSPENQAPSNESHPIHRIQELPGSALSKRVDQCNRQLARRVLCGGDPQHCCGSHGAGRVAADATPTGAHAGFFHEQAEMIGQSGRWKSDFTKCSALDRRTSKSPTPSKSQDFFADWVQTWSAAPDSASSSMLGCAAETGLAGWGN